MNHKKAMLACCCLALFATNAMAQSEAETDYYLPKTILHFTVKVEKTQYTPGQFAKYAMRYMRQDVGQEAYTTYRIIGIDMQPGAVPDTGKHFKLLLDKKHNIANVTRADNGQLLAINAEAQPATYRRQMFRPAKKTKGTDPKNFMTQDILNAGNTAKMAELTAQEIYDIRDSRSLLAKGQADYMPKDGAQLKLMLANLDEQENGLTQLFTGTVEKDTTWTYLDFTPEKEGESVLFRFSKRLGVVAADDLAGEPYYIELTDRHTAAPQPEQPKNKKKEDKNDIGLRVNQPDGIKVVVKDYTQQVASYDVQAAQFGTVEPLSGELFGKKQSTRLILDPLTGSIRKIEGM